MNTDQEVRKELEAVSKKIEEARDPLLSGRVRMEDILEAFAKLTKVEDMLWRLRDRMEEEGIGYLRVRQIEELLTDMNIEYSLPSIQLLLRVLIQSQQLASEEAQKRITKASSNLRKLQSRLSALRRA